MRQSIRTYEEFLRRVQSMPGVVSAGAISTVPLSELGPPLDPGADWRRFCWRKAYAGAWNTPPREIALARLARARAIGMTYREYTAVLLDTGVHL